MVARARLRRGFTLLEVMTTVVILIILAALAVTFMVFGTGKARMNNAVFNVTALLNSAQLRAVSHGSPHYVFFHQTPDNRVRIQLLERPDDGLALNWNALDLSQEPEVALAFTRKLPNGTTETVNARVRDELVLSAGSGMDSSGLAFLDLDSPRITRPLPAPFSAIPLATPLATPADLNQPTPSLLSGCNFCVASAGHPYGVLRFNADGTLEVMTGDAPSGAVIAFAPNTQDEKGFSPKLVTVSAPAGAAVVF
ncbi:pilus assembly FimT family protein [Hyalangium versicolor]|uniref:pilus assembly FimT family protein n=1 Tax=Hyalangium versicolor TaxID=2861190 RepID=UPI001CC9BEEF|nr:prepilin-type N-terminal cleavage/methylation domain-containing protein [Hyalangium versicolor]